LIRDLAILMHTGSIGCLYRPKRKQHAPCLIMKMSVNGASSMFRLASWLIKVQCGR
jgi:hypothetical protein